MKQRTKQSGFTLVELAIVLVIIGLIVGGVLAGQDLIKAAEQRASVGQIEKMDTAVNAFRGKYNGIPGDIVSPATFGFTSPGGAASIIQGNGVLDPQTNKMIYETAMFFTHLATAGLINEKISVTTPRASPALVLADMGVYAPLSKLGQGVHLWAMSNNNTNYYMLDNAVPTLTTGSVGNGRTALTPIVAYNMDVKLDDGVPTTGKVQAVDNVATLASTSANAGPMLGKCQDTTANAYQLSTQDIAETGACALRIKASF